MQTTHSVGIDLGTTYSCIAYLNEQGEPVTLPNQEGELSTPSVVLFEGDRAIVGTEALRKAVLNPDKVVQNSKRFIGNPKKKWTINGKPYTPVDIATVILKKLLSAAQDQIGPIDQAVITVPAQFSDAQRHATVEAGHRAGLQKVDIINEPVAAALCYVLGSEGLWFTELADQQRIMVYDLGGGTFDLSLVMYQKDEVSVIASSGDLNLGGIDWNQALIRYVSEQFFKEFGQDPRTNLEAMQYLSLESEQTKRSLSVRPRAAMACKLGEHRKAYQIDLERFETLTTDLVEHTAEITKRMLRDNKMGWAHVDVVLTTGGASRMPMIRNKLKQLSGTTLNTSLSPDLSIAHGATYFSGMLLTNDKFAKSILSKEAARRLASVKQRSVNARALGVLVKDPDTNERVPHYFLKANTPLPADATHTYGTVCPDQRRVHLQIVESGTSAEQPPVKLGDCVIDDLPPNLPEGSEVAVTISYDSEARVHVSAKDVASGKRAQTAIVRQENVVPQLASDHLDKADLQLKKQDAAARKQQATAAGQPGKAPAAKRPEPVTRPATTAQKPTHPASSQPATPKQAEPTQPTIKPRAMPKPAALGGPSLDRADQPVPLCNECGEPLNSRGQCTACGTSAVATPTQPTRSQPAKRPPLPQQPSRGSQAQRPAGQQRPRPKPPTSGSRSVALPPDDAEILELGQTGPAPTSPKPVRRKPTAVKPAPPKPKPKPKPQPRPRKPKDAGEDEFWQLVDD